MWNGDGCLFVLGHSGWELGDGRGCGVKVAWVIEW